MLESLFNKVTALFKRDSSTGIFLWILRNFTKHLFWRTSANSDFCMLWCTFSTLYYFHRCNLSKTTLLHQHKVNLNLVITRTKSNKESITFVKKWMCDHKSKRTCKFSTQNCKIFREWLFPQVSGNKWTEHLFANCRRFFQR